MEAVLLRITRRLNGCALPTPGTFVLAQSKLQNMACTDPSAEGSSFTSFEKRRQVYSILSFVFMRKACSAASAYSSNSWRWSMRRCGRERRRAAVRGEDIVGEWGVGEVAGESQRFPLAVKHPTDPNHPGLMLSLISASLAWMVSRTLQRAANTVNRPR